MQLKQSKFGVENLLDHIKIMISNIYIYTIDLLVVAK